jgi:hypothetical protein
MCFLCLTCLSLILLHALRYHSVLYNKYTQSYHPQEKIKVTNKHCRQMTITISLENTFLSDRNIRKPIILFWRRCQITIKAIINIYYLMVYFRNGFYPRVAGVISRTSEVHESEWYYIRHEWIKPYLKSTMRLFVYHIPNWISLKIYILDTNNVHTIIKIMMQPK